VDRILEEVTDGVTPKVGSSFALTEGSRPAIRDSPDLHDDQCPSTVPDESFEYHPVMALPKLAILISGRGSNMQAIVAACQDGRVPAEVALVVSNRADAAGLEWALGRGIDTAVLPHGDFETREAHDEAIIGRLTEVGIDWICLAGYMRLLSTVFVDAFPNRILNIHPSLLPAFPGLHGQRDAFDYGVAVSGCTVHLVDVELDHGPIVTQRTVRVEGCEDAVSLAERILKEEHVAYPEALKCLLTRSWRIDGRRLVFQPPNA
jgi:phosphoribosylglycinamide formyltransferase-1